MGFSGGGANITRSHTHSSAIVQDGGELNFDNVTQAGMAAGDTTFSNGTALQILNLGSATDVLTVNAGATAPEWVSAAASGGLLSVLGTYVATSAEATHTFSFTPVDFEDDSLLILEFDGNTNTVMAINIRINGESGNVYLTDGTSVAGGTQTIIDYNNQPEGSLLSDAWQAGGGRAFCVVANISLSSGPSDNYPEILSRACMWEGEQTTRVNVSSNETSISSVQILSTGDWEIGARATLYKLARA